MELLYLPGALMRAFTVGATIAAFTVIGFQYLDKKKLEVQNYLLRNQLEKCEIDRASENSKADQLRTNLHMLDEYYRERKPFAISGKELNVDDILNAEPR